MYGKAKRTDLKQPFPVYDKIIRGQKIFQNPDHWKGSLGLQIFAAKVI
jgi:hypothetical protein